MRTLVCSFTIGLWFADSYEMDCGKQKTTIELNIEVFGRPSWRVSFRSTRECPREGWAKEGRVKSPKGRPSPQALWMVRDRVSLRIWVAKCSAVQEISVPSIFESSEKGLLLGFDGEPLRVVCCFAWLIVLRLVDVIFPVGLSLCRKKFAINTSVDAGVAEIWWRMLMELYGRVMNSLTKYTHSC